MSIKKNLKMMFKKFQYNNIMRLKDQIDIYTIDDKIRLQRTGKSGEP